MAKIYGKVNMNTGKITINKAMNKSGLQYLDTALHESLHLHNPHMSEREVEEKAMKQRMATLAII